MSIDLGKPFIYAHELLKNPGGIWLGCDDKNIVEQAHIEGETGSVIVALYTEEQVLEIIKQQTEEQALEIERLSKYKRFESVYHEAERELAALRATHPAPASVGGVEEVEVVAWLNTLNGDTTTHEFAVMDWDDEGEPVQSLMTVAQHERIMTATVPAGSRVVPDALKKATYLTTEGGPSFKLTLGFESMRDLQAARAALLEVKP